MELAERAVCCTSGLSRAGCCVAAHQVLWPDCMLEGWHARPAPQHSHRVIACMMLLRYIFGGENILTTADLVDCERIYHDDVWRLCLKSHRWRRLLPDTLGARTRPVPRTGRCTCLCVRLCPVS